MLAMSTLMMPAHAVTTMPTSGPLQVAKFEPTARLAALAQSNVPVHKPGM